MLGLEDLPDDILHLILDRLTLEEIAALSSVSTKFYALTNHQGYWQQKIREYFPDIRISNIHIPIPTENNDTDRLINLRGSGFYHRQIFLATKQGISFPKMLHPAARSGHLNIIKMIAGGSNGFNFNETDKHGETLLLIASKYGHSEIVEYLLQKNVDLESSSKGYHNRTALYWAVVGQYSAIVKVLIAKGASIKYEWWPLHLAASSGELVLINIMLKRDRANLNQKDPSGETALMLAAKNGHTAAVNTLLEYDPDLDVGTNSVGYNDGYTALCWAIEKKHSDIAIALIAKGAALKVRVGRGKLQALHIAARSRQLAVVKAIVERDPSTLDEEDSYGNTPLLCATGFELLASHRDDLIIHRNDWDYYDPNTMDKNREAIFQYLLQEGAAGIKKDETVKKANDFKSLLHELLGYPKAFVNEKNSFRPYAPNEYPLKLHGILINETAKLYQKLDWSFEARTAKLRLMMSRYKQFNELLQRLDELNEQVGELYRSGHCASDPSKKAQYQEAGVSAKALLDSLQATTEKYLTDVCSEAYEIFRKDCIKAINQAKPILEKHRGWKRLLSNLVLAILGVGVIYGLACCVNKAVRGHYLFFNQTRSMEIIDGISDALEQISRVDVNNTVQTVKNRESIPSPPPVLNPAAVNRDSSNKINLLFNKRELSVCARLSALGYDISLSHRKDMEAFKKSERYQALMHDLGKTGELEMKISEYYHLDDPMENQLKISSCMSLVDERAEGVTLFLAFKGASRFVDFLKDIELFFYDEITSSKSVSKFAGEKIHEVRNKFAGKSIKVILTGHSLGGLYAKLLAYHFRRSFGQRINIKCLTFDAPGLSSSQIGSLVDRFGGISDIANQQLMNVLICPNYVNTSGFHPENSNYRIDISLAEADGDKLGLTEVKSGDWFNKIYDKLHRENHLTKEEIKYFMYASAFEKMPDVLNMLSSMATSTWGRFFLNRPSTIKKAYDRLPEELKGTIRQTMQYHSIELFVDLIHYVSESDLGKQIRRVERLPTPKGLTALYASRSNYVGTIPHQQAFIEELFSSEICANVSPRV